MARKEKTRILFVCSGNICRSPAAEGIALHHFALYGLERKIEVDSAGLQGRYHARQAPDPRMLQAAAARGYDLGKLRARGLETADYERFDLILGMDESHIEAMKKACPAPLRPRLKLLLDFAPETGAREVPDPYYGTQQAFEAALDLIEQGVIGLVRESTERA